MITKIQNSTLNYANNKQHNPNFKGFIDALRFLNTSPAIGACVVDLGSMVIPRTIVDTQKRGADAGMETGIRESSSTINHAVVGLVGLGAATAVSGAINHRYGIEANRMFVNNDAIDIFSDFWKESENSSETYYRKILSNAKFVNGEQVETIKNSQLIENISKKLANAGDKLTKELKNEIKAEIIHATGTESNYEVVSNIPRTIKVKNAKGVLEDKLVHKSIKESLDVMLETMHSLGNAFAKKSVDNIDNFAKELKGIKTKSALAGLAVSALVAVSVQPINKYLTKKRTGKEGFVGVQGREADKSTKFKLEKAAIAAAMGTFAFKTIGKNLGDVMNKIQFSSMVPNINQFKLLYGLTIVSRILSARDGNELRETSIKDFLGFSNWLILGGMVSKLTARAFGKEFINFDVAAHADEKGFKKAWSWITKSSVRTYDEILLKGAKEVVKDGQALKFRELFKNADRLTKIKVGKIALSQIAGYLYSGVILGVGIAKLNIFITGKVTKNKKNEEVVPDSNAKYFAQNQSSDNSVFANFQGK